MDNLQAKSTIDRLNAFSDGVLAIVVTLLILGIDIPTNHNFTEDGLIKFLIKLEPGFTAYVISFLLGITYWIQHYRIFQFAKYTNKTFIWINAIFLLMATLLPFASKLKTLYRFDFLVVAIFGVVHILCSVLLLAVWRYLANNGDLQRIPVDDATKNRYTVQLLINPIVCIAAIVISSVNVYVGTYFFFLIPVINIFFLDTKQVSIR